MIPLFRRAAVLLPVIAMLSLASCGGRIWLDGRGGGAAPSAVAVEDPLTAAVRQMAADGRAGDPQSAVALLRQQAEAGDVRALYLLGLAHRSGTGVARDEGKALRLFEAAAEAGEADAMVAAGLALREGGDPTAAPAAARWFERAAALGHPAALHHLSQAHAAGAGVPQDAARARALLEQAAQAGHAPAQTALGAAYEAGDGAPADVAWAARWYGEAARRGDAEAMYRLGLAHVEGRGVPEDPAAAVLWLTLARDRGHAGAARALGPLAARAGEEARRIGVGAATSFVPVSGPVSYDDPAMIVYVQHRLNQLGFEAGRPDGLWGETVRRAVLRFQADRGLVRDGVVGPATIAALRRG